MMSSVPLNKCRDQTTRIQADYWTIRLWLTNSQRWVRFITIRINERTCSVAQLKNSNVVSGMLDNNTTRCLVCYSFLPSATSLTTCSMAGTNRMTGCSDSDVKLANAPFRHFFLFRLQWTHTWSWTMIGQGHACCQSPGQDLARTYAPVIASSDIVTVVTRQKYLVVCSRHEEQKIYRLNNTSKIRRVCVQNICLLCTHCEVCTLYFSALS